MPLRSASPPLLLTRRIKIWKQTEGNIATAQRTFVLGSDLLISKPGQPSGAAHAHTHGGIELGAVAEGPAVLHAAGIDYELEAATVFSLIRRCLTGWGPFLAQAFATSMHIFRTTRC